MAFLDLFVVALIPVLKTLLITAVGLLLAVPRVNILGDTARHHLNNVVFYVFIPALVGGSLADTVTASSLISLWFMPVNILLTFIIGSGLGWVLAKITRTPEHLRGLVIGSCAAGNLGNLLLIIIPAVCEESNSPFGDQSTCSANGEGLVSLSLAISAVYIWTYVYNIIRAYGNVSGKDIAKASTISIDCSGKTLDMFTENYNEALLQSRRSSFEDCEAPDDEFAEVEEHNIEQEDEEDKKVTVLMKIKGHLNAFSDKINLQMWLTPTTIATIVGLLIGVISPIRKLMIGDKAPLRVIDSSASLLGYTTHHYFYFVKSNFDVRFYILCLSSFFNVFETNSEATVPSMTLIVGANLFKGMKKSGVGVWLMIGIIVVRYVVLPIVGIGVVKAARHLGFVGLDPLYMFVLLIQYSLPPAMAIGTITQLFEVGESECSVIMLWTYGVAAIALTLWSTFFMWLVS